MENLRAIVPTAEVTAVKDGLANYVRISLSAVASRALIHEHAKLAMQKIGRMKPYKITGPVTIEIEHTSRSALDVDMALHPEAEIIDARTVRYHGKDVLEAWTMARRH